MKTLRDPASVECVHRVQELTQVRSTFLVCAALLFPGRVSGVRAPHSGAFACAHNVLTSTLLPLLCGRRSVCARRSPALVHMNVMCVIAVFTHTRDVRSQTMCRSMGTTCYVS